MKIETLREFCDLAKTLNFSLTARRFYLSHSVLSKHISGLEAELGGKLFLRTSHFVQLTPLGELFVDYAWRVVRAHDEGVRAVREVLEGGREELRVGYLYESARDLLPKASKRFKELHPSVDLVFYSLGLGTIVEAMESGDLDLAVSVHFTDLDSARYGCCILATDEVGAVMSKGNSLAVKEILSAGDLEGAPILSCSFSAGAQDPDQQFGTASFIEKLGLSGKVTSGFSDANSLTFALQMDDRAVGILPRHLAEFYGTPLVFRRLEGADEAVNVSALWERAAETPLLLDFVDCLQRHWS